MVLLVVLAASLAQEALSDPVARALFAVGLIVIGAGLLTAVAHVASSYVFETETRTMTTTMVPTEEEGGCLWSPELAKEIVTAVKETVTALTGAPTWIAMLVLGTLLVMSASFFEGYDGLGLEVRTPKDQRASRRATTTSIAVTVAAENQVRLDADGTAQAAVAAESRQFERDLQLLALGVIPENYTVSSPVVIPVPPTATAIPTAEDPPGTSQAALPDSSPAAVTPASPTP